MTDDIDWPILARYVTGACSEAERDAIEAWIARDPTRRETVEALERIWAGAEPEPDHWNVPAAWRELVRKEAATREPPLRVLRVTPAADRRRRWLAPPMWAAAAAVVLALGAGLWWAMGGMSRHAGVPAAEVALRTVTTAPGQRMSLRLPDGTRVMLSVASTLRYPSRYGESKREVYLQGEAYFDVIHDEARPFAVHAGNAVARDLGTRFGVRAYADEPRVQVVVAEGKVSVGRAGGQRRSVEPIDDATLTAGQLARVDVNGALTVRRGIDLDPYLAWTAGRLVFRDARLRDVLPQLGRWYDVELRLSDSALGERRLTGAFSEESLPEVLRFLALSVDARYEREGRVVTLSPKSRAP